MKGNNQERIHSNPTSFPRHHAGKKRRQLKRYKVKLHKRKAKRSALPSRCASSFPQQNQWVVEDERKTVK